MRVLLLTAAFVLGLVLMGLSAGASSQQITAFSTDDLNGISWSE